MSLFSHNGGLLSVGGFLAGSSNCCCDDTTPCMCPDDLNSSYAIDGYTNAMFTVCPRCVSFTVWEGNFALQTTCTWNAPTFSEGFAQIVLNAFDDPACFWSLKIFCNVADQLVWSGKHFGPTPDGTYTQDGGCDTTNPTLVVS